MDKELISNGKKKVLKPETLMMGYGYKPEWSEGAVKCPIFQTSTFVFENAKDGKEFFEMAHGVREPGTHGAGLIYSRINNPDLEILEDRLTVWDNAEACAVFDSGMAAISTAVLELLKPGDVLLSSEPIYGGTEYFFETMLAKFGIKTMNFGVQHTRQQIINMVERGGATNKLGMIFLETPANPTNCLIDIEMCVDIAKHFSTKDRKVLTALDNTFLGPVFQHPLKHGIDLVLYSATKYIGGHSDVIAGACLGSKGLVNRVKSMRSVLGSMASPLTGWLLLRSLETLKMRMTTAAQSAQEISTERWVEIIQNPESITRNEFAFIKLKLESDEADQAFLLNLKYLLEQDLNKLSRLLTYLDKSDIELTKKRQLILGKIATKLFRGALANEIKSYKKSKKS